MIQILISIVSYSMLTSCLVLINPNSSSIERIRLFVYSLFIICLLFVSKYKTSIFSPDSGIECAESANDNAKIPFLFNTILLHWVKVVHDLPLIICFLLNSLLCNWIISPIAILSAISKSLSKKYIFSPKFGTAIFSFLFKNCKCVLICCRWCQLVHDAVIYYRRTLFN